VRLVNNQVVLSPSDLMRFRGCTHSVALDLRRLRGEQLTPADDSPDVVLLQGMGDRHEQHVLDALRAEGSEVVAIPKVEGSLDAALAETKAALARGPKYIYQAAFASGHWAGFADFLERVDRPSAFGGYSYEVIDTKLKRKPAPQHLLQLSVYAELLTAVQGAPPERVHVILGDRERVSFRLADYAAYSTRLKRRLEQFVDHPWETRPEPIAACGLCRWRDLCSDQWEADDNLCLVAGAGKSQRRKLEAAGVKTIGQLASMTEAVPKLAPETLGKLRTQARLQNARRRGGPPSFELKPIEPGRGLSVLPRPDVGDLFFDMEGDPYYEEGLEYLFGIYTEAPGAEGFEAIWAHDREAERRATAGLLTMIASHLKKHPRAHIYHYAGYEITALKRLASKHGVGEAILDELLRTAKFIDLYRVVQQTLFASEPSYSLKDLEVFYWPARQGGVTTAMDSVVTYEAWRETKQQKLLDEIRAYNEIDCRSTKGLRDWLIQRVRPSSLPWPSTESLLERNAEQEAKTAVAEAERQKLRELMEKAVPTLGQDFCELLFELAWFHQREDKPQWWAMFDRAERDADELIEDFESLGSLVAIGRSSVVAHSQVQRYRFPEQETKLRIGASVRLKSNLASVSIVDLHRDNNTVDVKFGPSAGDPPDRIDLIPGGPIDNQILRGAVSRVVNSFFNGERRYQAIDDLLRRRLPQIASHRSGAPLLTPSEDVVKGTIRVASKLENTCLAVQGPPGTGKTYLSAQVIVSLLKAGKRVGVTSNSHKAIDNLLNAIAARAKETSLELAAVKKASPYRGEEKELDPLIRQAHNNKDERLSSYPLVGGTAWLFARPEHDQAFDYLFVDEAGQVSLANILATGCAAKNIVLVGDPMQLAQPIAGAHPGDTGMSCLEYLLAEHATIPSEKGIFLPETRRMHPKVCRYISDIVYESRLQSDSGTATQILTMVSAIPHRSIAGINFVEVPHEARSQSSPEEATAVCEAWHRFLGQRFKDRHGRVRELGPADILVVSPYNAQVNLIASQLPSDARVGTVDRFQGQEAPVCLVSMATSSSDELPRNIEFLFSVNRLNVAISRAQAVAIVFASPRLLDVSCSTVDQMRLVNALCAVQSYAEGDSF